LNLRPSGYEPDELPAAPPRDLTFRRSSFVVRKTKKQLLTERSTRTSRSVVYSHFALLTRGLCFFALRASHFSLFSLQNNNSKLLFIWWRGKDSNLRKRQLTDLQSAPFSHSGTPPLSRPLVRRKYDYNTQASKCQSFFNSFSINISAAAKAKQPDTLVVKSCFAGKLYRFRFACRPHPTRLLDAALITFLQVAFQFTFYPLQRVIN
jgi:hypothetical protein